MLDEQVERLQTIPSPPQSLLTSGEELRSFASIASKLPGHRTNSHVNPSTLFRWATRGLRLPSGEVVRLEAAKVGGAWRTSLEAVARFSAKLTEAAVAPAEAVAEPTPTPAARNRAAAKSSREADAIFGPKK
jgi:hypothetical protein